MNYTLSQTTAPLKRSVMRDLLALAVDPQIISLAGGLPANELLPIQEYAAALQTALQKHGARALQYSPQYPPLREWIADHMQQRGVTCTPDQVFITNGAQQGLTILSQLFLDPGQPAVTEEIVFTGVSQITQGRGAQMLIVPTDLSAGLDVVALEEAFKQCPRLAVVIPNFHNPLGVSLPYSSREKIAQLAARYCVPVIEDDPYATLRFEGEPLPPIKAFDEDGWVFHLGSFSKMLAPGVRLGWMVAPAELLPRITVIREALDLETPALTQRAVAEYLFSGHLETHLEDLRRVNRERCTALLESLDTHLGSLAHWTQPTGGLFVWVALPPEVDAWEMFPRAVENKVAYIPGSAFAIHGNHRNTLRLNFSNVSPERIREGVARLAEVIKETLRQTA